jgi:hypothetical protein
LSRPSSPAGSVGRARHHAAQGGGRPGELEQAARARHLERRHLAQTVVAEREQHHLLRVVGLGEAHRQRRPGVPDLDRTRQPLRPMQVPERDVVERRREHLDRQAEPVPYLDHPLGVRQGAALREQVPGPDEELAGRSRVFERLGDRGVPVRDRLDELGAARLEVGAGRRGGQVGRAQERHRAQPPADQAVSAPEREAGSLGRERVADDGHAERREHGGGGLQHRGRVVVAGQQVRAAAGLLGEAGREAEEQRPGIGGRGSAVEDVAGHHERVDLLVAAELDEPVEEPGVLVQAGQIREAGAEVPVRGVQQSHHARCCRPGLRDAPGPIPTGDRRRDWRGSARHRRPVVP